MAKRKNNANMFGLIALALVLVFLILAIVGVCIDWVTRDGVVSGKINFNMSDLLEIYGESDGDVGSAFNAMAAFAVLAVILAGITTILAGITKVLGWKLFKFLLVIAAIIALACGVVSIITSYTFCDKLNVWEDLYKYTPAAGAWLTGLGAALCGITGVFIAAKS